MIAWVSTVAKKLSKSGLARFRAKAWPAFVYSVRIAGETANWNLPSMHDIRTRRGWPAKKAPETRTFVSITILKSDSGPA